MIKINNLFSGIPEIKIKHFLYEGCLLYCQNEVWNSIMLFADVLFNIFTGVFDVLNDVYQNVAVVLWCLYSITPNLNATICVHMLLFQTSMLLFVSVCCYSKPIIRASHISSGRGDANFK